MSGGPLFSDATDGDPVNIPGVLKLFKMVLSLNSYQKGVNANSQIH